MMIFRCPKCVSDDVNMLRSMVMGACLLSSLRTPRTSIPQARTDRPSGYDNSGVSMLAAFPRDIRMYRYPRENEAFARNSQFEFLKKSEL